MEDKATKQGQDSAAKTAETLKTDINAPQGEHAVTRDTTPSIEKPGQAPTQPSRPKL